MIRKLLVTLLLLTGIAAAYAAADVTFSTVPPRTVIEGNKFSITFRLKNAEGNGFQAPEVEGCTLVYGPAVSTVYNSSYTNGKMEQSLSVDYSMTYRADKAGTYTIGAAKINVNGKTMTTKPTSFTILPPGKDQKRDGRQQGAGQGSSSTPKVSADGVFVRIILNKSHAYEQEAILCTIKLYTTHSISSFIPTVQPSFDGFVIEERPIQSSLNDVEHYNGNNYMTAILKQCIIFPQKAGKLTINSGKYDVTVVQYERLGGFWGGSRPVEQELKTTSNSASVVVNPLPQPQPEGFTGAVGSFSIDSRLSTHVFKTNEAASLIYDIRGTGNIKYIKEPVIDFPTEFEQYQPQAEVNASVTGSNVTGSMTIDYTFIPQSVGNFTIGADKFVYFNPETKKYVTLTTPSYDVKVAQGATVASAPVNKQGISSKNTDILHIKMGDLDLEKTHTYYYNSWWYWPSYILLDVLLAIIIWVYSKQVKLNADIQGRRLANADKVAKRRLNTAKKFMNFHDNEKFYDEILRASWGYLSDKLQLPASQLTRENIAHELNRYGAPESLATTFIDIIDECEMARYTPVKSDEQIEQLYTRVSGAMKEMEGIKRAKR